MRPISSVTTMDPFPRGRAAALASMAGTVLLAMIVLAPAKARALSGLLDLVVSPDVTVDLSATVVADDQIAVDDLGGTATLSSFPGVPVAADLVAYHDAGSGEALLAFDIFVELPGSMTVRQGDVVRYDGVNYTLEFDADANGVPLGARVDAVTVVGPHLLLSYDITVSLAGVVAGDEDLVRWDGAVFSLFFDGSAAGVAGGLDLDGAHRLPNNHLLLSFDGSGEVGSPAVSFADEDVLEYSPLLPAASAWELAYDGSAAHSGWGGGPDLDAVSSIAGVPVPGLGIIGLGMLTLLIALSAWGLPRRRWTCVSD